MGIQCLILPISFSQEFLSETSNSSVEAMANEEILQNQQINQDEGYGAEDEEYYGSEEDSFSNNTNKNLN